LKRQPLLEIENDCAKRDDAADETDDDADKVGYVLDKNRHGEAAADSVPLSNPLQSEEGVEVEEEIRSSDYG
jgi:hypothetical protein